VKTTVYGIPVVYDNRGEAPLAELGMMLNMCSVILIRARTGGTTALSDRVEIRQKLPGLTAMIIHEERQGSWRLE